MDNLGCYVHDKSVVIFTRHLVLLRLGSEEGCGGLGM
jgi:hypothetical protein